MERFTTNKPVSEMGMYELAHNGCYIGECGEARYRDFSSDIDARELTRNIMRNYGLWEIDDNAMLSDDIFDDEMMDNLFYGPDEMEGLIALFYRNLWAMAELYERLKRYEEAEEQGKLLKLPCKVGDVVAIVLMIPSNERKIVVQAEVKEINVGKYLARIDTQIKVEPIANRGTRYKYYVSEWGTNIFATLAEAEAALQAMKGEDND